MGTSEQEERPGGGALQLKLEQPRILTFFSPSFLKYFEQWQVCTKKALGPAGYEARVVAVNLSTSQEAPFIPPSPELAAATSSSTLSSSSTRSVLQVSPPSVQFLLPKLLYEHVARGEDIMHIDADAFVTKDPSEAFAARFPEADIVASADCANDEQNSCKWYVDQAFLARHGGKDPLAARGFMLNMGLVLFRGNPRVAGFLSELMAARRATGETWGDQTLTNEVLEQWGCEWAWNDGRPTRAEGKVFKELVRRSAKWFVEGACAGGGLAEHSGRRREHLKIVVLPWSVVTRFANSTGVVAFHPGSGKEKALKLAKSVCA